MADVHISSPGDPHSGCLRSLAICHGGVLPCIDFVLPNIATEDNET